MVDVHCPNCEHVWEDEDLFDEDAMEAKNARLNAKEDLLARMREELKAIVDFYDSPTGDHGYTKADIQRIRRLVEE